MPFPIPSHGVVVGDGLTRDEFATVGPSFMIEQLHPGAEVTNPLTIQGESNTFEGTVLGHAIDVELHTFRAM